MAEHFLLQVFKSKAVRSFILLSQMADLSLSVAYHPEYVWMFELAVW